jgi:DNA-binding transcriptional ArsR family regulator
MRIWPGFAPGLFLAKRGHFNTEPFGALFSCNPPRRMKHNLMVQLSSDLDLVYSALSDGSRRAMIARLARGPASVSELAAPLQMSLTAVSKHIALLEHSGFVVTRKTGRVRICHIEPTQLRVAQDWLAEQRALWEARLDSLDAFLLEGKDSDEQ